MFTPNANGYGYGWVITQFLGHPVAVHDGEVNGFLTFIARFLDANNVLIVLSNQETVDLGAMIQTLSVGILSGGANGTGEFKHSGEAGAGRAIAPHRLGL